MGLFTSWKSNALKNILGHNPHAEELAQAANLTLLRINSILEKHDINSSGHKKRMVDAFYCGSIEADLRMLVNMRNMSEDNMIIAVLNVAIFDRIKGSVINNDVKRTAVLTDYKHSYMDSTYDKFRKLGMGSTGLFNEDSEQNWNEFILELNQA